jgi:hypothetical protein
MSSAFSSAKFESALAEALEQIQKVLENNRNPAVASEVPHTYPDKFELANYLINSSFACLLTSLESIGATPQILTKLKELSRRNTITLRFTSEERCSFLRTDKKKIKGPETTTEIGVGVLKTKVSDRTTTKITEHIWKFEVKYSLVAYKRNDFNEAIPILSQTIAGEIKNLDKENPPKPPVTTRNPIDVSLSWLFECLNDDVQANVSIDRTKSTCHTPRRNSEAEKTLTFYQDISRWGSAVVSYFDSYVFPNTENIVWPTKEQPKLFVPIVPIFEGNTQLREENSGAMISRPDVGRLLEAHKRGIDDAFSRLEKLYVDVNQLINPHVGRLVTIAKHLTKISEFVSLGIEFLEKMLRDQLIAAIGKELTPVDFTNYMAFHNRKLFKASFEPKQFCYAVRRPNHYPEGIIAIEENLPSGPVPIITTVNCYRSETPMKFSINAATTIHFFGDRFLHSYVAHRFSGQTQNPISLIARARQFSSFILLVGRIVSHDVFEPLHGLIIKNKDELQIPLILETIPTPKAFKDAIESLSPEQQAFAKAYRSLQLSGTLFGICVIQIKPQLEKLLNLPNDSLTKEIQLTQDLQELFIEYQIPSDLVSYGDDPNASLAQKLAAVKSHVQKMKSMISKSKERSLAEHQRKLEFERQKKLEEERREQERREQERREQERREQERRELDRRNESEVFLASAEFEHSRSFNPVKALIGGIFGRKMSVSRREYAYDSYENVDYESAGTSYNYSTKVEFPDIDPHCRLELADDAPVVKNSSAVSEKTPEPSKPQQKPNNNNNKQGDNLLRASGVIVREDLAIDVSKLPSEIDSKFLLLDIDNAVRGTIINIGETWSRNFQKALLGNPESEQLTEDKQLQEKNKTFDLLDALSRSGVLSIDESSFHVVIGSTHVFDKTLLDTVIQDNVNPIDKIERSLLIVASTIHRAPVADLIKDEHLERVKSVSPQLF